VPQLNQLLRAYLTRHFVLVDHIAAAHEGDHVEFVELLKTQHATQIAQYAAVCRQLRALNLHAVLEQLATTVVIAQLAQRVHGRCANCFDVQMLHQGLLKWFDSAVSAWLDLTLQGDLDVQTGMLNAHKRNYSFLDRNFSCLQTTFVVLTLRTICRFKVTKLR